MKQPVKILLALTASISILAVWVMTTTTPAYATDIIMSVALSYDGSVDTEVPPVGTTFTATVRVDSASNQEINTADVRLSYDETLVHVVSITNLSPLPSEFTSTFDNSTGELHFVAVHLGPGNQHAANFEVIEIEFEVVGTGLLTLEFLPGTEVALGTSMLAGTVNVGPAPTTVTLQQIGANPALFVPSLLVVVALFLGVTTAVGLLYARHARRHQPQAIRQSPEKHH
ncbi:MAG: hypothetical protein KDD89_00515 [Anaerolineales bacterium]|nr:hypothetical protein [Anaerolineales bacterium]